MEQDSQAWSGMIADLAVDALVDAKLLKKEDFEAAAKIVATEIEVRLALGDLPPNSQNAPS
jgi:hypothetical protein